MLKRFALPILAGLLLVVMVTTTIIYTGGLSPFNQTQLPVPNINSTAPTTSIWAKVLPYPLASLAPAPGHNPRAVQLPNGNPTLKVTQVPRGVVTEWWPNETSSVFFVVQSDTGGPNITHLGACYNVRGFRGDPMLTEPKYRSGWHCSNDTVPHAAQTANVHQLEGRFDAQEYYAGAILANGQTIYSNKIVMKPADAFYPEPTLQLTVKRIFPGGKTVGSGEAVAYHISVTNTGDRPTQSPLNSLDVSWSPGYSHMNYKTLGKLGSSQPYSSVVLRQLPKDTLLDLGSSRGATLEFNVQGLQPGETREIAQIALYAAPTQAQTARFGVTRSGALGANIEGSFEEALTTVY